jgi:hypothetical protein
LASIVRALRAKGFVSFSAIARELNGQKIPTPLGRQMAPSQRWPTAAALGKAGSSLKQLTLPPGPFFCPWNRFSARLVVGDSQPAKLLQ